jgi:hypothetical protein
MEVDIAGRIVTVASLARVSTDVVTIIGQSDVDLQIKLTESNFGGDGTRSSAGHGSSQISARDFDMSGMSTRDQAVAARNASRQLQVRPARAPGGPTIIISPP